MNHKPVDTFVAYQDIEAASKNLVRNLMLEPSESGSKADPHPQAGPETVQAPPDAAMSGWPKGYRTKRLHQIRRTDGSSYRLTLVFF